MYKFTNVDIVTYFFPYQSCITVGKHLPNMTASPITGHLENYELNNNKTLIKVSR